MWQALVNVIMKLQFPQTVRNFLNSNMISAFQEGLSSIELELVGWLLLKS